MGEPYTLLSTVKLTEPVEHFCAVNYRDKLLYLVANGAMISILEVSADLSEMHCVSTIHAFQKPVLKLVYDSHRNRVIAAGLDQQIKFFELFDEDETKQKCDLQLRLQYKIKMP